MTTKFVAGIGEGGGNNPTEPDSSPAGAGRGISPTFCPEPALVGPGSSVEKLVFSGGGHFPLRWSLQLSFQGREAAHRKRMTRFRLNCGLVLCNNKRPVTYGDIHDGETFQCDNNHPDSVRQSMCTRTSHLGCCFQLL